MGSSCNTWCRTAPKGIPHGCRLCRQGNRQVDSCNIRRHERLPPWRSVVPAHGLYDVAETTHIRHHAAAPLSAHRHSHRTQNVRFRGVGARHERQ